MAPRNAPNSKRPVMIPLLNAAPESCAGSVSGNWFRNCFIVKTIDKIPWSKPNKRPPIQAEKAAATTIQLAKTSLSPGERLSGVNTKQAVTQT